jgi:hypothetical protein
MSGSGARRRVPVGRPGVAVEVGDGDYMRRYETVRLVV